MDMRVLCNTASGRRRVGKCTKMTSLYFMIYLIYNSSPCVSGKHILQAQNVLSSELETRPEFEDLRGNEQPQHVMNSYVEFTTPEYHDKDCRVEPPLDLIQDPGYGENIHVDHGERMKRDLTSHPEKYMEVLLVTDSSVVNFHGRGFLEQYLMTQMNLVDSAYHHPTLQIEINVIVTEIFIVDDRTANGIVVTGDGKRTLDRFCEWTDMHRRRDPYHIKTFDVALYITRKDIGPAGYAPVTGMCHPNRSCAVNKDAGVSSAYVITHEIGHILGMVHDGYGNDCDREAEDGKVMAATVQANYDNVHWTECSRRSLERYIGGLHCLNDKPKMPNWPKYTQPYGESWSLDEQCRQEFGEEYSLCRVFASMDMCDMLWCSSKKEDFMCKTKRSPPLPGTSCGHNKWCMNRRCQERSQIGAAVDGGWTDWSEWNECSRSCGVGVQFKYRRCTNPTPLHNGRPCDGEKEKFQLCNQQTCETKSDFRADQCREYDHTNFAGNQRHNWLPTSPNSDSEQCKLTCISAQTGVTFISENNVVDGTPCTYKNLNDICINGKCQRLGCDKVLGSNKKEDTCGVCGGDGSSCKTVTGEFDEILPRKQYHKLLELPEGARNILIREDATVPHLFHFLAMASNGINLLNDNDHQSDSKSMIVQGTEFKYDTRGTETLSATGPLLGNVQILVYSLSDKMKSKINYQYSVPVALFNDVQTELHAVDYMYMWVYQGWSKCSVSCDGGTRTESYSCIEQNTRKEVDDDFCDVGSLPSTAVEECNSEPCFIKTYKWRTTPWSDCSTSCGRNAYRTRALKCFVINLYGTGVDWQVEESLCNQENIPDTKENCEERRCDHEWIVGEWSQCSKSCGLGFQKRTVKCGEDNNNLDLCIEKEPNSLRLCQMPCPESTSTSVQPTTELSTTTTTTTTPTTTTILEATKASSFMTPSRTKPSDDISNIIYPYDEPRNGNMHPNHDSRHHNRKHKHKAVNANRLDDDVSFRSDDTRDKNLIYPENNGKRYEKNTSTVFPSTTTKSDNSASSSVLNSSAKKAGHIQCVSDKHFFCKMQLGYKQCKLPLYAKYCCNTCSKLLGDHTS